MGQFGPKPTCQYEEQEGDQKTISHIKHTTRKAPEAQFADPIQHSIHKHIKRACASRTECSPLPMVIFRAEEEVYEQDRYGGAGDDHDAVAEEEEAEHVVDLSEPHVVHDKVEFDEDGAKRKDSDEEHRRYGS